MPLFKKGSRLDAGNYRPVSILNVLSKVLERAVHTQLSEYLEKRGIFLIINLVLEKVFQQILVSLV